jgi:signal transduction histidine kinase
MPALADARSRVLLVRLGAATIAVFQVLFWVVRSAANPGGPEHAGLRLAILAVCAAGGAASVGVTEFRRARLLAVGFAVGIMVLQIWLAVASGLTLDYAVPPTILLFAVCSLATDTTELLLFSLTAALVPLVLFAAYHVPGTPVPGVALLGLAGSGAAGAIVSWFRVRTQTALTMEIARREEVEVQLRGTRAHLESILNATSDGLLGVRYEAEGPRITFANRRFGEIFALDPEEIVGAADEAIRTEAAHHFADPEEFERDVRRLYADRDASCGHQLELVTPRRSMLERWTGPIRDTHGAVVGRIWAFRDVTSHRDMTRELRDYAGRLEATNAELARASRAKDAFLANLSHELRTPLSIIIGYQNLVLEGGLSEAESVEFIQRSTASATHLLRLISDMLDLTRLEAGTAEIAVQPLPVRNVLAEVHDLTHVLASAKGLALRVATESDARVLADPQRLKQVLLNLVGNALKFTSAGSVSVSAEAENGCVRFAVRDTGRGIPREQQALLFRKFMRLDTRMTAPEEGVGLGLSICRELVALMGGAIELSSDGPGTGTEVRFTLPPA